MIVILSGPSHSGQSYKCSMIAKYYASIVLTAKMSVAQFKKIGKIDFWLARRQSLPWKNQWFIHIFPGMGEELNSTVLNCSNDYLTSHLKLFSRLKFSPVFHFYFLFPCTDLYEFLNSFFFSFWQLLWFVEKIRKWFCILHFYST